MNDDEWKKLNKSTGRYIKATNYLSVAIIVIAVAFIVIIFIAKG